MDRPVWLSHAGRLRAAGIRLRPGAAGSLLRIPACEVTRQIVDASDVIGAARDMPDRLSRAHDVESQVAVLEAFLERLSPRAPVRSIEEVVAVVERSHGRVAISRLAQVAGVERRTLERAFQREVGLSPKAFARILRFQHARRLVSSGCALSAAALACGYCDQAHMTGDFVEYAGVAPAAWRERPEAQLFALDEHGTRQGAFGPTSSADIDERARVGSASQGL
jgi:AraC-like DNA-binding protein